jgi:hypothetical protein
MIYCWISVAPFGCSFRQYCGLWLFNNFLFLLLHVEFNLAIGFRWFHRVHAVQQMMQMDLYASRTIWTTMRGLADRKVFLYENSVIVNFQKHAIIMMEKTDSILDAILETHHCIKHWEISGEAWWNKMPLLYEKYILQSFITQRI